MRFVQVLSTLAFALSSAASVSAWCGHPAPSEEGLAIHRRFQAQETVANVSTLHARQVDGSPIQVYFHLVFRSQNENAILHWQLERQVALLNEYFSVAGFSFVLAGVDARLLPNLGPLWLGTPADRQIKQAHVGDLKTLNFYVVTGIIQGFAGYATFPWTAVQDPQIDGVVMDREHIPGGRAIGFNTGKIGVHEAGHWMGLLHTFQDGCSGGDFVDDTPPEASPASGCPEVRDTCPEPGTDPINNHMDYSNDACRFEFTAGQTQRMYSFFTDYRLPPVAEDEPENSDQPGGF